MNGLRFRSVAAAAALTLFLGVASTHGQTAGYQVIDLGTLGGSRSSAVGINGRGDVIGNSETADGDTHAFHVVNGTMNDLGTLGGKNSHAAAISNTGLIVGRSQAADGSYRSFVSLSDGQLWDLSSLDNRLKHAGFATSVAVNSLGHVVGYIQTHTDHKAARSRVFIYKDLKITDLGTFGGEDGVVAGINDVGQIVGYFGREPHADYADHRGVLMTGNVVTPLGSLGGRMTTPTDINNAGQAVGFAQVQGGEDHAFLYANGKIADLGTLSGGTQSFAYGINVSGQAVGSSDSTQGQRAVLFEGGKVIDLNTLIPSGSGWVLTEAKDINDAGLITGTGIVNGQQRAFLLKP
ncbi:MAG TPA: hypothetical protein VNJ02_20280 [Vicinamibacterales bacterium]|nr:hypothetical protein [Vicinamibacterales bacterium]